MKKINRIPIVVVISLIVITLAIVIYGLYLADKEEDPNEEVAAGSDLESEALEEDELDMFKDLIIQYDESTGKIVLDNSQCSSFIKENVIFTINHEMEAYESGDVVEIIGYVDMNAAKDNRYKILSTTYEYIVK